MLRLGQYISQLLVSKRDDPKMRGGLPRTFSVLQVTQIMSQMNTYFAWDYIKRISPERATQWLKLRAKNHSPHEELPAFICKPTIESSL